MDTLESIMMFILGICIITFGLNTLLILGTTVCNFIYKHLKPKT